MVYAGLGATLDTTLLDEADNDHDDMLKLTEKKEKGDDEKDDDSGGCKFPIVAAVDKEPTDLRCC